jgi:hypothetical protein
MNIYSQHGDKVVYNNFNDGGAWDQGVAKQFLEPNQVYTVDYTEVHSFSTDVYLVEVPNIRFNSVVFSDHHEPT